MQSDHPWLAALVGALLAAACQAPSAIPADAGADRGVRDQGSDRAADIQGADAGRDATVEDAVDGTVEPPGCLWAPCAQRPIVFVHGYRGSNSDWDALLNQLLSTDGRYDAFHRVGVQDHQGWPARSLGRREWLFAFDYYVAHESDGRESYTAGPGRIGSNAGHACSAPSGQGHLVAGDARYDAGTVHDYAADLAAFVERVLRATGADAVDLVGHSMGGLVVRSFLSFYDGAARVRRVLLLASPVRGVSLAGFLSVFPAGQPSWMNDHEIAEIDGGTPLVERAFRLCDEDPPIAGAWAAKLTDHELTHPPAVELHVMSGQLDLAVNHGVADHPLALTHRQALADHSGMLEHADVIARVRELLGGTL